MDRAMARIGVTSMIDQHYFPIRKSHALNLPTPTPMTSVVKTIDLGPNVLVMMNKVCFASKLWVSDYERANRTSVCTANLIKGLEKVRRVKLICHGVYADYFSQGSGSR